MTTTPLSLVRYSGQPAPLVRPAKGTNFHPEPLRDFLKNTPPKVRWVWDELLPEGALVLLASFMKSGKSTLAYALAVNVARGQPFLRRETKRGGVLILAVEEHRRDVARRLIRFGARRGRGRIYVHAGHLKNSAVTMRAIRELVKERRIRLVILDTLAKYWRVRDENSNAQLMREANPWLKLARDTGAVVLLVHHERKAGGQEGRSIRGGSALFGIVDQALLLNRRKGAKTVRRLRTIGRYEESPPELVIELRNDEYVLLGRPDELGRRATRLKVWKATGDNPQGVETLAKKSGLTPKQARTAAEELRRKGKLVRKGAGVKRDPFMYQRKR